MENKANSQNAGYVAPCPKRLKKEIEELTQTVSVSDVAAKLESTAANIRGLIAAQNNINNTPPEVVKAPELGTRFNPLVMTTPKRLNPNRATGFFTREYAGDGDHRFMILVFVFLICFGVCLSRVQPQLKHAANSFTSTLKTNCFCE